MTADRKTPPTSFLWRHSKVNPIPAFDEYRSLLIWEIRDPHVTSLDRNDGEWVWGWCLDCGRFSSALHPGESFEGVYWAWADGDPFKELSFAAHAEGIHALLTQENLHQEDLFQEARTITGRAKSDPVFYGAPDGSQRSVREPRPFCTCGHAHAVHLSTGCGMRGVETGGGEGEDCACTNYTPIKLTTATGIREICDRVVNCVAPASDGGHDDGAIYLAEEILNLLNGAIR